MLAAGVGERFTGTKQLALVRGRSLVAHVVAAAHAAGVDRVLVVVGHDADAVADAARLGGDVEVVVNERYRDGQASSLTAGIAALEDDPAIEVAVVLLGDQPQVLPQTIAQVCRALLGGRGPGGERPDAARASYADGPGHPVAFRRGVWPQLRSLTGDRGARHLLDELDVAHVLVAGRVPADVDTAEDLARLAGPESGGGPGRTAD